MKITAIMLAIVLLLSLCPPEAAAAETEATLRAGERVVLWYPEKDVAVSSADKSGNRSGVKVAEENGVPVGFSDTEVWTVEPSGESWRFLQNGQALSMAASGNKLKLEDVNDCWVLEEAAQGQYLIRNTARGLYLAYSSSRGYWNTAASGTAVSLYILPRKEEPEPPAADGYRLYFGQLHAHTDLSDGLGTVEEAFTYASKVPGLDFFAVTDHSQTFDNAQSASLTVDAAPISEDWARGKAAAEAVTNGEFVGIFGFEMTWNQGQGHMSTFRTPGFASRDQDAYRGYASGMEHYYADLLEAEGSVSQFNHPGDADGDFKDFAGHTPELDDRITLIEVGGGSEAYDRALAKGWHLAPTNNQNNHAGHWGDESSVRTVVLAEELTEASLYEAMADYRVYATEDADLEILYRLNEHWMGRRVPIGEIGETVNITAALSDPTDASVGTVAVITEGGTVLAEETVTSPRGSISITLPADRAYYYLRITQPDGDVALTAPVWLDPQDDLGISALQTASQVTTAGEEQTILLELYNDEGAPWTVTSVSFTIEGKTYAAAPPAALEPYSTASVALAHTFPVDGVFRVNAEVTGTLAGQTRTYSQSLQVVVMPPPLVDDVIIDGTHGSGEAFGKTMALAKAGDVDMILEREVITREALSTCRMLIIPAPMEDWKAGFIENVKNYVNQGGSLILLGASVRENPQASARLNRLLEALNSSLRANADTMPEQHTACISPDIWLEELTEGQHYAQLSGCSVTGGSWLVKGMDQESVLLAVEDTGAGGNVFLSGGTFLADHYLNSTEERWAQPSANQTILETILDITHRTQEIISLSGLRRAQQGRIYLAEGLVTAGTANPNTTFENTIYIQDATGAIAASPYGVHGLALGTRVRILGSLEFREGVPFLQILRLEIRGKEAVVPPAEAEGQLTHDTQGGELFQVRGRVINAQGFADGVGISCFQLEDADGNRTTVLVEAYIRSGSRGKNELARIVKPGNTVSAVGLVHLEDGETVLRLRDCDEVTLLRSPDWEETNPGGDGDTPEDGNDPEGGGDPSGGSTEPSPGGEGDSTGGEDPDGGGDTDEPEWNPDTGDRSGIRLYGLLAIVSLLGLAWLNRKP